MLLGMAYRKTGQVERSIPYYEARLQWAKKESAKSQLTMVHMSDLALAYQAAGKPELAVPLMEEAYNTTKATFGNDFRNTRRFCLHLAMAYAKVGKPELALRLLENPSRPQFASGDGDKAWELDVMSTAYLSSAALQAWEGRVEDWGATCARALEFRKDERDPGAADRMAKACCLIGTDDKGRQKAALARARHAVEFGKDHPNFPWFRMALGMAQFRDGQFAEAEGTLLESAEAAKDNPHITGTSAFYRAMALFRQGKIDAARKLAAEAAGKTKPLPEEGGNPLAGGARHDDVILWLSYKEAKALVGFDSPAPAPTTEPAPPPREKK
jgi:tetratricopeptide (TPR) repeat protein